MPLSQLTMVVERRQGRLAEVMDYLNGLTPSARAARRREVEQQELERASTQETYSRRLGRMRKLYQHLEKPAVVSRLTGFHVSPSARGYVIPHLGSVAINISGNGYVEDESQSVQQLIVEKHDGSKTRFNYRKLFEEGDDLRITEEELAGAELLIGLTDVSLNLLSAFQQEPFKSKGPRGEVGFMAERATGEVSGERYEIRSLDTTDVTTRWVGDLVPDKIICGSIVIYLGDVGYVIQHKKDLQLKMVSKIDLLARERNKGDALNDRFGFDDVARLSSILDAIPGSHVTSWVYVKPGTPNIYRGEVVSPERMRSIEYREIRKQRRTTQRA